jgi:trans-aconitate methyltransferase
MPRWDPGDYERSSSAQKRWARELISKLELEGDERVLDIGSGDGMITAELSARVPLGSVVGLDSSEEMIEFARRRYPPEEHPNLSFQLGDARRLEFEEEFDLVVSFACLHWIEDHLPVLQGIRRCLRPSGRVLIQCGGRGNAASILEITEEVTKGERWRGYFRDFTFPYHFYGPEEYRPWLARVGLKVKRVELVPKEMVHEDKKGLEGIIRATWLPYTERLPEELRREFVSEIADRYIQSYPPQEGKIGVKMMRLEVDAER